MAETKHRFPESEEIKRLQKEIAALHSAVRAVVKYDLPNHTFAQARSIWLTGPWKKLLNLIPAPKEGTSGE
jgi:hypothetical protein